MPALTLGESMKDKKKPFLTLGKTKISKFFNLLLLVGIIGYSIIKLSPLETSSTSGFEVDIPFSDLNVKTQEELVVKLSDYEVDLDKFLSALEENDINIDEFKDSFKLNLSVQSAQDNSEELLVEFESTIFAYNLKPVYLLMAKDIQAHVLNKKS
tara:strand:- start:4 stop:468 length:465 start_codon:yes stop_codon:yes gene_type:complete